MRARGLIRAGGRRRTRAHNDAGLLSPIVSVMGSKCGDRFDDDGTVGDVARSGISLLGIPRVVVAWYKSYMKLEAWLLNSLYISIVVVYPTSALQS